MMKLNLLLTAGLFALSGGAFAATLVNPIDAQFLSKDGALELKVSNGLKDVAIHVSDVNVLLPKADGSTKLEVVYQAMGSVDIPAGGDGTVLLLPVKQLADDMQQRGIVPSGHYARAVVANGPMDCGNCGPQEAGARQEFVGFSTQAVIQLQGKPVVTKSHFNGYLVFLAK